MANQVDEAMGEIVGFMQKTGKNSIPCHVLAEIADRHGHGGSEIVTLFFRAVELKKTQNPPNG